VATYAIGDVQGCFEELRSLLGELNFDRGRDHLWFVGDLVNRGPESAATLRFVRALGACAVTVLGNHDLHLVAHVHGYARQRNDDTFGDVLEASDRDELVDWLRGLPLTEIVFTNTIPLPPEKRLPNMRVLSVAPLLGEVIRRAHEGRSVGEMFNE